jgi:chemotaxis protein MotA
MIGTLIGLIIMLGHIDTPDAIGPGMAVALVTTFYGTVLSNLVFAPIAGKLKLRNDQEILIKEIMMEGVLSIQQGENPRIIEHKLKSFLAPRERYVASEGAVNKAPGEVTINA